MTKREKRLHDLRRKIKRLERDRELGIKLLVKAVIQLPALYKQEAKQGAGWHKKSEDVSRPLAEASEAKDPAVVPVPHVAEDRSAADNPSALQDEAGTEPLRGQSDDDLEIPVYLRRSALQPDVAAAAFAVANAHNKPPTPEQKKLVEKERRKVKEEHKRALLTGQKRKWPATGRAALDAIRK